MAETAMQGCAGEMLEEVSSFASFPMLIHFILLDATFTLLSLLSLVVLCFCQWCSVGVIGGVVLSLVV